MYWAEISEKRVNILSGRISQEINAVGEFEITVPYQDVDIDNVFKEDVRIYFKNKIIADGFCNNTPSLEVNNDGIIFVNLKCLSRLGELSCMRADSSADFDDMTVRAIINYLLSRTPREYNDIALEDAWHLHVIDLPLGASSGTLTLDLKEKESLFSQIMEVVNTFPGVKIRNPVGTRRIDIGIFDTLQPINKSFGESITTLNIENPENEIIREIEAWGGDVENPSNAATLTKAASAAIAHPLYTRYPIVLTGGSRVVRDILNPKGCSIVRKFSHIKVAEAQEAATSTKPAAKPAAEQNRASFTLWLAAVYELMKNNSNKNYSGTFWSYFDANINPGDLVNFSANLREPIVNYSGEIMGYLDRKVLEEEHNLLQIEHNIGDYTQDENGIDMLLYNFKINESNMPLFGSKEEQLFRLVQEEKSKIDTGTYKSLAGFVSQTHTILTTQAANFRFPSPYFNSQTYMNFTRTTFNSPAPPGGTTAISVDVQLLTPGFIFKITRRPNMTNQNATVYFSTNDYKWPGPTNLDVQVDWFFYA